jgi:hypothetical protein
LVVDRTLAAVRLAIVEERRGNPRAADDYWIRAERHARSGTVMAQDRISLRRLILEIDQRAERGTSPPS